MSGELFERVIAFDTMHAAWMKVAGNHGAPGGDGVTVAQVGRDAMGRLSQLCADLSDGTYRPGPLRHVDIPKRSGGTRRLSIPCVIDRVAQGAVTAVLVPLLDPEFEDSSFGYRPGRSVQQAVERVAMLRRQGFEWVVDADIERYFDTVPHAPLLERLSRHVGDTRLLALIGEWLAAAAPEGVGLPQGSPISPLLANLYLDEVDERIERHGVRLVRFADDFVLLCRSEAAAAGARQRVAALLDGLGLSLHPEKTRIVSFDDGFTFLGRKFVRSVIVRAEQPVDDGAAVALAAIMSDPPPGSGEPDGQAESARGTVIRPLYLRTPGRVLDVRNQAFVVRDGDNELLAVMPAQVGRIEIGPHADATLAALRHAVLHRIPLVHVDGHGGTLGRTEGVESARAGLHRDQAEGVIDPARRLDLARIIAAGRVHGQRTLLKRLNRRRRDAAVDQACVDIRRPLRRLEAADSVDVVMGFEGEAAALYWPVLGHCLAHGWHFDVRRRRPPPDPVNLVFSWTAAMLARDMRALVLARGLHPGFGALHSTRDRSDAAVHDLVEEFRAPVAEALTVYLFNNRILSRDVFSRLEDGRIHIEPEGARAVIRHYEALLDRPVKSPRSGDRVGWRQLMREQVDAYAAHFTDGETYRPYRMDY